MKNSNLKFIRILYLNAILIILILVSVHVDSFANENNNEDLNVDELDFSTQKLILETDNVEILERDKNIVNIKSVFDNMYIIEYSDEASTKEGYKNLSNNKLVDKISSDEKLVLFDDDLYPYSVDEGNWSWGVKAMGLDHYTDYLNYQNNSEILVGVLDSGIRATHEAFCDKIPGDRLEMSLSKNYVDNSTDVTDTQGHGTNVASIITESTPSNVKVVPLKIVSEEGASLSNIVNALNDIKDKVDVINISLGRAEEFLSPSSVTLLNDALVQTYNDGDGPIIICAAGNKSDKEGTDVAYPANNPYTIAVSGLSNVNGSLVFGTDFSNYGEEVEFSAPGDFMKLAHYRYDDEYITRRGTSFAAPLISSAAALIKTENHNLNADDIKEILKQNVDDLGEPGKDIYYGYGSVNFISSRFEKPNIAYTKALLNEWETYNTIIANAVCDDNIEKYACVLASEEVEDTDWHTIENPSDNVGIQTNLTDNGKYNIYFMDSEGDIGKKEISISNIDNINPKIVSRLKSLNITENSFKLSAEFIDEESGIDKIVWNFKSESDKSYLSTEEEYNGDTNSITVSKTYSNLKPGIDYYVYVEIYDETGNYTKTAITRITTDKIEEEQEATVTNPEPQNVAVTKIALNKTTLSLEENKQSSLVATIAPSNATNKTVTWKSSNTNVATVSSNGVVKGVAEGTTVITATCGNYSAKCTVTVYWSNPFKDVKSSDWEYGAVKYCYKKGYIKGYNQTTFAPDQKLTRAEIVTILYRMSGSPVVFGKSGFSDVSNNMWYTNAIIWAQKAGVVHGYDGTAKFGPNDNILRQDLAGILRNYSIYKGKSVNVSGDLTKFSDYKKVSNYALVSVKWAVGAGVITGNSNGTLNPKGNTTRAEAAAMIYKYTK